MTESSTATPAPGLFSRILGIIFSPRATFDQVVAHPRWLGALAALVIVSVAATTWFLSTEVGKQALLDQQVEAMERFGIQVTDEQFTRMSEMTRFAVWTTSIWIAAVIPVMVLVVSGILFVVFNVAMGGEATFKQMLAVVAHAWLIGIPQTLFVTPLNYARESMSSATNLAVFFPMLDEAGFLARLLGTIDLVYVWLVIVLAIGLSVLYRKRTSGILTGLLVAYGVIAAVIATVFSFVGSR